MAVKQRESERLGVLMIDFCPVVREGPQAILTKDERKDMAPELLLQSIHRAVDGGTQMSAALLHTAVQNLIQNGRKTLAERTAEAAHLTEREVDVLRLMGNGDSNKIIAATLGITLDTTKKHVRNVIAKMQARSRTHAAIIAAQVGIVGNPVAPLAED